MREEEGGNQGEEEKNQKLKKLKLQHRPLFFVMCNVHAKIPKLNEVIVSIEQCRNYFMN